MNDINSLLNIEINPYKVYNNKIKFNIVKNTIKNIYIEIEYENIKRIFKIFLLTLKFEDFDTTFNKINILFNKIYIDEKHSLNVQIFLNELKILFQDIKQLLLEKIHIDGDIEVNNKFQNFKNNYIFNGYINNNKVYFTASQFNIDYFKKMLNRDNLFFQKI